MWRILDRLYLGTRNDVMSVEGMKNVVAEEIRYILNVAFDVEYRYPIPDGIEVLWVQLKDGQSIPVAELKKSIKFIGSSIANGKVLVHCNAGVSRSPSIIIAYLVRVGYSYPSALNLLEKAGASQVHPADELLDSLKAFYGEEIWYGADWSKHRKADNL